MHRPTFYPAVGGRSQGGNLASFPTGKVSARNLPSQLRVKRRRVVTGDSADDVNDASSSYNDGISEIPSLAPLVDLNDLQKYAGMDRDADADDGGDSSNEESANEKADGEKSAKEELSNSDDDSNSSSEDEEEALRRELDAIRQEREAAREAEAKSETQTKLERLAESLEETKVERSWTDDTLFKIPVQDTKYKPRFINDSIRSDFHKRFLKKYVQ